MAVKREFGISIDTTTEGKLRKLTEHFKGAVSGDPERMSDDELLAVLLGWYFRNLPQPDRFELKSVMHAFLVRLWNSKNEPQHGYWEYRQIASRHTRGSRHTGGNVLTPTGIRAETLDDMVFRVLSVFLMSESIQYTGGSDTGKGFEDHQLLLSVMPDQVIVDSCIYGELREFAVFEEPSASDKFPYDVEAEVARRADVAEWRRPEFETPNWPERSERI